MTKWIPVLGFEHLYQVNDAGGIRSIKRYTICKRAGKRYWEAKVLKQILRKGYLTINASSDGKIKILSVHRLVAQAFISNEENKPEVNHINGIKTDNRIINLEWATTSENQTHAVQFGLITHAKGHTHGNSKLTEQKVLIIRNAVKFKLFSQNKLAKKYNVSPSNICSIIKRKSWNHIR